MNTNTANKIEALQFKGYEFDKIDYFDFIDEVIAEKNMRFQSYTHNACNEQRRAGYEITIQRGLLAEIEGELFSNECTHLDDFLLARDIEQQSAEDINEKYSFAVECKGRYEDYYGALPRTA